MFADKYNSKQRDYELIYQEYLKKFCVQDSNISKSLLYNISVNAIPARIATEEIRQIKRQSQTFICEIIQQLQKLIKMMLQQYIIAWAAVPCILYKRGALAAAPCILYKRRGVGRCALHSIQTRGVGRCALHSIQTRDVGRCALHSIQTRGVGRCALHSIQPGHLF